MLKELKFEIQDLQFTTTQSHINKMEWTGCVTLLDSPSDGPPGGAGGMCVVFDSVGVTNKCQTMVGMGLNCEWPDGWFAAPEYALTGHDERFKIGYVSDCWVEGNKLMAKGVIWKRDFDDISFMIQNGKDALGFSVECMVDEYKEAEDGNLHVTDMTFTGVALLWKNTAAFEGTQLMELVANRHKKNEKEVDKMNEEQIKALMEGFMAQFSQVVTTAVSAVEAKIDANKVEMDAKLAEVEGKLEAAKVEPIVVASAEPLAVVAAAATVVETPKALSLATAGKFDGEKTIEQKFEEIDARKDLSIVDKIAMKHNIRFAKV
jgi:hypothetical protein